MTKRKHHDSESTHPEVKVVDSKHEHGGPVIGTFIKTASLLLTVLSFTYSCLLSVTFPGTEPAQDTLFDIYKNRTDSKKKQRIIAGETEKIEFVGKNYGPDTADLPCR